MVRPAPSYTRLGVDERRRQLLELGRRLFSARPYDEVSTAAIAREAGISKALLYHYFPSKQAYFVATLQDAAAELAERVRPDPDAPPADQLASALDAWLGWVEENREAYGKLLRAAGAVSEVRELIDHVRTTTAAVILERLLGPGVEPPPELRAAVHGWLWFMDGACIDWVDHDDLDRSQVHRLLVRAFPGAITAAGHPELIARILGGAY